MAASITLLLFSSLIASLSQVLLKRSAQKEHRSRRAEYLNLRVLVAYGMLFVSMLLTMLSLRRVPLSLAPVIEASSYFYVALLSYWLLGERPGRKKVLGIALILIGIIVAGLPLG